MHRSQRIDKLRGIAVLLVMLSHHTIILSDQFMAFERRYLNIGAVGVLIFFCVSGYVIALSIRRHEAGSAARAAVLFAVRRLARLLPAYFVIAAALWWFIPPPFMAAINTSLHPDPVGYWLRFATFTSYLRGDVTIYHGAEWTLTFELGFYIACTLAILLGSRASRPTMLWFPVIAVCLATMLPSWLFANVLQSAGLRYLFFLVGVVTFVGRNLELRAIDYRLMLGLCCGTIVLRWVTWSVQFGVVNGDEIAAALALCAFFGVLHFPVPLPRVLAHIGLVSYSLYLLHDEVPWVVPLGQMPDWMRPIIWAPLAFVAASASFRLIEQPGIAAGRRIVARLRGAAAPVRVAVADNG